MEFSAAFKNEYLLKKTKQLNDAIIFNITVLNYKYGFNSYHHIKLVTFFCFNM